MAKVKVCDLCGRVIDSNELNDQTIKVKRKRRAHGIKTGRDVTGKRIVYTNYASIDVSYRRIDCHNDCIEALFKAIDAERIVASAH